MAGEVHKGDIGTIFELTIVDQAGVAVDVSSDPSPEILFRRRGQVLTKEAAFKTNGVDGVIQYTTLSGDIDKSGDWTMQGHVILTGGEWHTTKVAFQVLEIIA